MFLALRQFIEENRAFWVGIRFANAVQVFLVAVDYQRR